MKKNVQGNNKNKTSLQFYVLKNDFFTCTWFSAFMVFWNVTDSVSVIVQKKKVWTFGIAIRLRENIFRNSVSESRT